MGYNKEVVIEGIKIGEAHKPFIVAEMSGNHNQSLDRAIKIVDAAAEAGVNAIKLQTYKADTMTLDLSEGEFFIKDPNSLWKGSSLYKLYQQAHTPWDWHRPILDHCKKRNIICFSTPFDSTSVDFLEDLNIPAYKIASFELTDLPLILKVASTGKPMIMSTGMAAIAEIDEAVQAAQINGCKDLILLKCTSTYPATPINSNIITIPHMRDLFGVQVGLSDHTLGIGVSIASVAMGASLIEKHLTLKRSDGGVDSEFSMEPEEMKSLVIEANKAWQALGVISYGATEPEKKSKVYRRSIFTITDIKMGDEYSLSNIGVIRPGVGLPPKYLDQVLGRKAIKNLKKGTPLSWELL